MMMRQFLFGLAALPFLANIALAGQPLSDQQMDKVTAGDSYYIFQTSATGSASFIYALYPLPTLPDVYPGKFTSSYSGPL
jgi:hypothetical protein